jgi:hypothetical protein
MDRSELIITALQQRIGEITSGYETQIAMLRAELTLMSEKENQKIAVDNYSNELTEKTSSVN